MPARLSETYQPGDLVEIAFHEGDDRRWLPGRVLMHQHPGVWIRTSDGNTWFVTNTQRIRHVESE
jgi:hypothetical protein